MGGKVGRPLSASHRQVISAAHKRRRALGYAIGRPSTLTPAQCSAYLAAAVARGARARGFTPEAILGAAPADPGRASAYKWARRLAMYMARAALVPDLVSARLCGWSEEEIRAAVVAIQDHPRRRAEAEALASKPTDSLLGAEVTHPLLVAAQAVQRRRREREEGMRMLEQIVGKMQAEATRLEREILEKRSQLEKIRGALRILNTVPARGTSRLEIGRERLARVQEVLAAHPEGMRCNDIAAALDMNTRAERQNLATSLSSYAKQKLITRLATGLYGPAKKGK